MRKERRKVSSVERMEFGVVDDCFVMEGFRTEEKQNVGLKLRRHAPE